MPTKIRTAAGYCHCRFPQANLNRYPIRCTACGRILDAYMVIKTKKLAQQNRQLKKLALVIIVMAAITISILEVIK